LDSLDRDILLALRADGRQTNTHLAATLGLSSSAMLDRVRRLERDHAIRGYHADVDPEAIGLGLQAFIAVELKEHSGTCIEGFERGIVSVVGVEACYHVTGRFDYLLQVAVRDLAQLGKLLKVGVAAVPGVAKLETLLMLSQVGAADRPADDQSPSDDNAEWSEVMR
jgi:Lrp/AsnC family leucine-responsive transcriptional regulator